MTAPTDVKELQTFLGLANYLGRFTPHLATVSAPLRDLCNTDVPYDWGPEHDAAFSNLKKAISSNEVLRYYAIENDLIHTIGSADEQLDELNTMTRSSYIDTADLKDSLASTKDKFTVFSLNVQSINSKFKLIYPLTLELNNADMAFSAICLQESWLTDDSDLSQYQLPNYNLIHQGGKCSGHGGLLLYLHKRYSHVVRKLYSLSDFWAVLFIDISVGNLSKHITLGNIYRPPKLNNNDLSISTFIDEFAPILSKLVNEKSETIITGDFNIDLLKVNDKITIGDYFDLFCTNGFYPKITLPTRFSRDSCILIDQIFCKFSTATITSTAGIIMSSISDHLPYFISINNMQSKPRMTPNRTN